MNAVSEMLQAASRRVLPMRMRPDLVVGVQHFQGQKYYVVKDPLSLAFFRFQEEEFALLQWLDGRRSLSDLQQEFETRFAPQKITPQEIWRLVASLHESGLVLSDRPGQGAALLERGALRRRRQRWMRLANLLAIRFRGFDPDGLLTVLHRAVGWVFSPGVVAACLLLVLSAVLLVTIELDAVGRRLPAFQQFFSPVNVVWLLGAMAGAKVLHELGHALVAKRFGTSCHEMGLLLLVFMPCLYCNVSDSWMLPSKWRRAAIGAAGMYVELVLAAVATWVWWLSEPGLVHHLCLGIMFVCSVSTLLFNANPLLRYDGYYILADLVEIPNLRQKATAVVQRFLARLCLGLQPPEDPFLPRRRRAFLACYAVAGAVYRWLVLAAILWFLHTVLRPWRLEVLGNLLVLATVVGLLVLPLVNLVRLVRVPGSTQRIDRTRAALSAAAVALLVAGVLLVPLPHRVTCPCEVRLHNAEAVYAPAAGELAEVFVQPGETVAAGRPLVSLHDAELELAVAVLQQRRAVLAAQYASLQRLAFRDPQAQGSLAALRPALEALQEQLAGKQQELARLQIVAPRAGTVIPPPAAPPPAAGRDGLGAMQGTPLDPHNRGALISQGALLCLLGDPDDLEAVLYVPQSELKFVRAGQRVELMFASLPGTRFVGHIDELSLHEVRHVPAPLTTLHGGPLAAGPQRDGRLQPQETLYWARVRLKHAQGWLPPGMCGRARITVEHSSLGRRVWHALAGLVRFGR
jgi:putative peptide zinc metalloprotease protein